MEGILFDIKRFAIHDGPGIRTTVFLKGCPLRCWWCHNPESRDRAICGYSKKERVGEALVEREETVGRVYSVEAVMREIEKDRLLYEESGGGVTFSGGEPFLQYDFLLELLNACSRKGIHTCVDTTGHIRPDKLREASRFIRLFLYDLKHPDPDQHRHFTGVGNRQILENLQMLDQLGKDIQIRYPLIPGINDGEAEIAQMLGFLSGLTHRYPVSILPYHKIGRHKYQRFGIEDKMEAVEEPAPEQIRKVRMVFEQAGYGVSVGD